jgi:hypothetical protein
MWITADDFATNQTSDPTRQENEIVSQDSNLSFVVSSYSSMSLLSIELHSEETWCAESCMLVSEDERVVHKQTTTKQSSEGSIKTKQIVIKKELSWSDQFGKKLVEYGVEVSYCDLGRLYNSTYFIVMLWNCRHKPDSSRHQKIV